MPRHAVLKIPPMSPAFLTRNRKLSHHSNAWGRVVVAALVLVAIGIVLTSLMMAWTNLQYTTLSYQISQAEETKKQHLEMNRKLRIELANITAISRLEKLAVETYNMGPPQPSQAVTLP